MSLDFSDSQDLTILHLFVLHQNQTKIIKITRY